MDTQHVNDQTQLEQPQSLQQALIMKFKAVCINGGVYVLGMSMKMFV